MAKGSDSGVVELVKLKNGLHEFRFDFGQDFFETFESSSLNNGNVHAVLSLDRLENNFRAALNVTGTVKVTCDYCLEDIDMNVNNDLAFIVKLTDEHREDDLEHEIYYVLESQPEFNVSQHVYDLVYLSLPLKKTCSMPGELEICNKDMIKKLGDLKDAEEKPDGEQDPRWDKLKDLLN